MRNLTKHKNIFRIGAFSFDVDCGNLVSPDGSKLALRPQTTQVLRVLAAHNGELVSKDELMSVVWVDTHVTDDSLVQCISEIRRTLGPKSAKHLSTIPKQGYRLDAVAMQELPTPIEPKLAKARNHGRHLRPTVVQVLAAISVATLLAIIGVSLILNRDAAHEERVIVAVLPFENLSGDSEQDYLSSGLAEDLLIDLSRIDAMKVLSRGTTFGLRDTPEFLAATMQRLGASYLVDGSVQRDGGHIRISVQLVELSTGANIWAQRYDRELGDLFEIQDDVRSKIVKSLAITLAPQEQRRLLRADTANVSAYDLLLQGRQHEASLEREGVTRAIEFYKRALELDPNYTEAYARLANMYDFASRFEWGTNSETDRTLAIEMAERSVRLDPENPFAHWTLGRVLSRLGRAASSSTQAINELQKAIEIDPNYADAYAFISLVYVGEGQIKEGRDAIRRAFDLNQTPPSWYFQNRGIVAYFERDYGVAAVDFQTAVEKNPTAAYARLWLAASYAMAGDQEAAEWEVEEAMAIGEPGSVTEVIEKNRVIRNPNFRVLYAKGLKKAGLPD